MMRRRMLAALAAAAFAVATLAAAQSSCAPGLAPVAAQTGHDDCEPHEGHGSPAPLPGEHDGCAMIASCTSPVVVTPTFAVVAAAPSHEHPAARNEARPAVVAPAPDYPPPRA